MPRTPPSSTRAPSAKTPIADGDRSVANSPPIGARPALPRTGVILVGTPGAVRQGDAMLRLLASPPIVAGCVLVPDVGVPAPHSELALVSLGALEDLPLLTPRLGLKAAVVCMAEDHPKREDTLRAAQRAGLHVHLLPTVDQLFSSPPRATTATTSRDGVESAAGASTLELKAPGAKATWTPAPSVDLSALINRVPHDLDRHAVAAVLTGKRVLITGAGGSIGSELARVAASFEPSQLILMERGENALFEIDRLIAQKFPNVPRKAVLHDVVDAEATMRALEAMKPHTVFHAAAHKHVPLMEDHPAHAVTNNLFGTKSIADAAVYAGAERFVMISSDKAVNPTSVMGATKRMAEMYMQALGYRHAPRGAHADGSIPSPHAERGGTHTEPHAERGGTRLSMVRFGNVLGSNASVLTIWSQQLGEGGPITVTDPRMTRYFMTIPEAATLVIQSTTLDLPGEQGGGPGVGVFVLDMGEPIPIAELALRFIRAHGMTPRIRTDSGASAAAAELAHRLGSLLAGSVAGPGLDVVFTGARPGEKLHEELAYAAESLRPTTHPGIRAWAGPGFEAEVAARAERIVVDMAAARMSTDRYQVLSMIRKHVPEMRPPTPSLAGAVQPTHPNVG